MLLWGALLGLLLRPAAPAPTTWVRGGYGALTVSYDDASGGGAAAGYSCAYGATVFNSTPGALQNATAFSARTGVDRLGASDALTAAFGADGALTIAYYAAQDAFVFSRAPLTTGSSNCQRPPPEQKTMCDELSAAIAGAEWSCSCHRLARVNLRIDAAIARSGSVQGPCVALEHAPRRRGIAPRLVGGGSGKDVAAAIAVGDDGGDAQQRAVWAAREFSMRLAVENPDRPVSAVAEAAWNGAPELLAGDAVSALAPGIIERFGASAASSSNGACRSSGRACVHGSVRACHGRLRELCVCVRAGCG